MSHKSHVLRAVIIDDEMAFINTLEVMLACHTDFHIVGMARGVEEGLQLIEATEPHVVFLDVEMEDGTGFDLLNKISRIDFKVIFVTAFDHYAIEAFRFSAIDYLLKPIVSDDLAVALDKVRHALDHDKMEYQYNVLLDNIYKLSKEKRKIVLKEVDTHHIIQLDDILWCQAEGSYTRFFLEGEDPILVSRHLKEFEKMLNNSQFFRVHRSHLVNLNKIKKFEKSDGAILYLEGGYTVPVSVRKKDRLTSLLAHL